MLAFIKLLHYLFLIVFFSETGAKNYCSSNICNNSKQHTLCKFQSQDPARHCIEYEKTIKSTKDKQAILDKLNSRRNKVAAGEIRSLPSAENMMKLEWNEELELSAQRWANQCVKHSVPDIKDSCRDLGTMFVEQNIASIYGEAPGLTPLALVDVWYMELLNVNATVIPRYQRSKDARYSHYDYFTQLVWAQSKQVGCGGVKFKERLQDSSNEKKRAVYRLVCNFAPGGNILNSTVYDDGLPCSKCSKGACDSVYNALCSSETSRTTRVKSDRTEFDPTSSTNKVTSKHPKGTRFQEEKNTIVQRMENNEKQNEENLAPFDYFPHMHDFVRPTLATSAKLSTSCKDLLVVDDFVELLKKKLSTDPMFRDLLQTTTVFTEHGNNGFTDAFELISKIYSKKMPTTTAKLPDKHYINSTLLVDLVEAVIFRNSDKVRYNQEILKTTQPELDVNPVKIQAELAEVRRNPDFTGHLFFPEDVDVVEDSIETTDQYYDVSSLSSAQLAIEDIKRSKATRDFLDEILESETIKEKRDNYNMIITKRDLLMNKRERKNNLENVYYDDSHEEDIINNENRLPEIYKRNVNPACGSSIMKYSDLLKKLSSDLKILKLNERFHCAGNFSQKCSFSSILILIVIYEAFNY